MRKGKKIRMAEAKVTIDDADEILVDNADEVLTADVKEFTTSAYVGVPIGWRGRKVKIILLKK